MGRIRSSNTDLNRIIGARIRALRLEKGLTQTKVAAELDISFQQFQKYEKGSNRMTVDSLQVIAEFMGVPARALLDPLEGASSDNDAHLLTAENIKILHDLGTITDPQIKSRIVGLVSAVAKSKMGDEVDEHHDDDEAWPVREMADCPSA